MSHVGQATLKVPRKFAVKVGEKNVCKDFSQHVFFWNQVCYEIVEGITNGKGMSLFARYADARSWENIFSSTGPSEQ